MRVLPHRSLLRPNPVLTPFTFFMAFLTMEVKGWYWRARPGTRDHVSPANLPFAACLPCTRVPARAQADVPVSYPRLVACSQNTTEPVPPDSALGDGADHPT
jgi:hypothetical protein